MAASTRWAIVFLLVSAACDYKPVNQGARLYKQHCASCHMDDGTGLEKLFPTLAKADFVVEHSAQLPCIIRHGISMPMVVNGIDYEAPMPGNAVLTEVEIANLVGYILKEMNGTESAPSLAEVRVQLNSCEPKP